jgi:hypothetical protein
MVEKIEIEKLEVDDMEEIGIGQHESQKRRVLAVLAVPVLLVCPSIGSDTLAVSITQPPVPLPCVQINAADESCFRPEADHPAHGEGSGELPTVVGIGASGAFTNATSAVLISTSWGPLGGNSPAFDIFRERRVSQMQMLHVAPVTPRRPFLPLARRGLK